MAIGKSHTFNGRTIDKSPIYRISDNLILPYQFTNLPVGNQGELKWTEEAPVGWVQYGPYYNLFLKYYLRRDGSLETIPNGGENVHSVKCASIGSSVQLQKAIVVTTNTISNNYLDIGNWSVSSINYTVTIPEDKNNVKFGVFYKVNSSDPLRDLNFAGIYLSFNRGNEFKSYVNYAIIHGGGVNLLGNNSTYTYFNTYDALKTYESYHQWVGSPITKTKKLAEINQSSVFDTWQYLEFNVPVPTFDPLEDGEDGKATYCTLSICFGENNYYINDLSEINSGSVTFYYPFLNLN